MHLHIHTHIHMHMYKYCITRASHIFDSKLRHNASQSFLERLTGKHNANSTRGTTLEKRRRGTLWTRTRAAGTLAARRDDGLVVAMPWMQNPLLKSRALQVSEERQTETAGELCKRGDGYQRTVESGKGCANSCLCTNRFGRPPLHLSEWGVHFFNGAVKWQSRCSIRWSLDWLALLYCAHLTTCNPRSVLWKPPAVVGGVRNKRGSK